MRMIPAIHILVIGDEILSGRIRDTNAPWLRDHLADAGFDVRAVVNAGDDIDDLTAVFRDAARRADVVLATGGLGPTSDDVTVEALARAFGRELRIDEAVVKHIRALFRRRNRTMSESNIRQARIPVGGEVIENEFGTAPGTALALNAGDTGGGACTVYLMPGVPKEMRDMFEASVLPRIRDAWEPAEVETASVMVTGMSESMIFDTIRDLPGAERVVSYYPGLEGIEVRIRTDSDAPLAAQALRDRIAGRLGDAVFSTTGERIEEVVAGLLFARGLTVGVAESCTGGLVSHLLTGVPGSSAYFLLGVTAYANEAKTDILGVDPSLIAEHGAVSAEVAAAMADGVRRVAGADIGLSTTGIAGPGGATPGKPLGLMFAGIADSGEIRTNRLQFFEDRHINKGRMSRAVLNILRCALRPPGLE